MNAEDSHFLRKVWKIDYHPKLQLCPGHRPHSCSFCAYSCLSHWHTLVPKILSASLGHSQEQTDPSAVGSSTFTVGVLKTLHWLKKINVFSHSLESGSPKSWCWWGHTPSKCSSEDSFLKLVAAQHPSLPLPSHGSFPAFVCLSLSLIKNILIGFRVHSHTV